MIRALYAATAAAQHDLDHRLSDFLSRIEVSVPGQTVFGFKRRKRPLERFATHADFHRNVLNVHAQPQKQIPIAATAVTRRFVLLYHTHTGWRYVSYLPGGSMTLKTSRIEVVPSMSVMRNILMHTFGRPQGLLGRLGGIIMTRMNADCGSWVSDLLEVGPSDSVLEVGFGPGVLIQYLSKLAATGHVAGIDPSREMVEQARARNTTVIQSGRVDLRHGSVESLPFDDNSFDKALAINSMQVWPDAMAGLREIRRVMKPGSGIALGFTPYSGQPNKGLTETLLAAGFTKAHVVETPTGFCALATRP